MAHCPGQSREASLGDQAAAAGKSKGREEETGRGRRQKQELQLKLLKGENTKLWSDDKGEDHQARDSRSR